jgi:prepilin-type N-terminal cleavage/methylation domain-containing protein/prepilin-type processing-associated H-X9-DG protein
MRSFRCQGFTLVEMLVVLAVIAVLGGLVTGGVASAKKRVRTIECVNNMRQIGLAVALYCHDHDETFPQSQHQHNSWVGALETNSGRRAVYRCPVDPDKTRVYSFAINDYVTKNPYGASSLDYSSRSSIARPSDTMMFAEARTDMGGSDHFHFADSVDAGYSPAAFEGQVDVRRHQGAANYLFVDGHLETLPWERVQPLLTASGSAFVHPGGNP